MARGLLCWSVQVLADKSEVGTTTIKRVELIDGVLEGAQIRTLQAIAKAFTDTGKVRFDGLDGVHIMGE
jgi:hypothetical protein